jgi:uncharacterized Zn-binding protein involved in type VI secretion
MAAARVPKRILPIAVSGARTNTGAIVQFTRSSLEIHGKKAGLVGDTVHDPKDGEVTILTGLHGVEESGSTLAGLGSVLSNGSFIVDAGQQYAYWAEFEDGAVSLFVMDEPHG